MSSLSLSPGGGGGSGAAARVGFCEAIVPYLRSGPEECL